MERARFVIDFFLNTLIGVGLNNVSNNRRFVVWFVRCYFVTSQYLIIVFTCFVLSSRFSYTQLFCVHVRDVHLLLTITVIFINSFLEKRNSFVMLSLSWCILVYVLKHYHLFGFVMVVVVVVAAYLCSFARACMCEWVCMYVENNNNNHWRKETFRTWQIRSGYQVRIKTNR